MSVADKSKKRQKEDMSGLERKKRKLQERKEKEERRKEKERELRQQLANIKINITRGSGSSNCSSKTDNSGSIDMKGSIPHRSMIRLDKGITVALGPEELLMIFTRKT